MNVAMIGAGRLGLPVSLALAEKFPVKAFDLNPLNMRKRQYPHWEKGPNGEDDFQARFDRSTLAFCPLKECVETADVIFVAVETPHQERFDGTHRLPSDRADFSYAALESACRSIAEFVRPHQTVAIISTVLPGTMRRVVKPILGGKCRLAYAPLFIAMGRVLADFASPEFVLIGEDKKGEAGALCEMYRTFYGTRYVSYAPNGFQDDEEAATIKVMSWESAELTKCAAYNCFISQKVMYANAIMEIAHKIPNCNCDDVIDAVSCATDRLLSPKYLRGGGPDSGGCHPRDLIAMSWLGYGKHLSANIFESIAQAREQQTEWLVDLFLENAGDLNLCLLGKSYKPETNIATGSGATLMARMLTERGRTFAHYDPHVDVSDAKAAFSLLVEPHAYLIATKHACFRDCRWPVGSVIVDPHRYIEPQEGVTVIPVGIGTEVN